MLDKSILTYKDRLIEVESNLNLNPEMLANYLLASPDLKKNKLEYIIFNSRKLFKIAIREKITSTWRLEILLEDRQNLGIIDYHNADYDNVKQVLKMLKLRNTNLKNTKQCNINDLCYDIADLIKKTTLSRAEQDILFLYQQDFSLSEIANNLSRSKSGVSGSLNSIAKKIVKTYISEFHNFVNLNYTKGKYKECNKCKKVLLISEFRANQASKDGLRSICKKC